MTPTRSTARRYAEAGFEIAERDGTMVAWLEMLDLAQERLTDPQVMRLLSSPAVPLSARLETLSRILGERVTDAPRNLLSLLVRRGRFELLPGVIREFRRLYRQQAGIVEATVVAASLLDDATLAAVHERLTALTGNRVELAQETDPSLLGGLQVRIGDRLIDASVRGRLERLRNQFSNMAI